MLKDQIVRYLEDYVRFFEPPLAEGVAAISLRARGQGKGDAGFDLVTSAGECRVDQVVVAVGGYHTPQIPRIGERLPEEIVQLHSSAYRNPRQLPPGDVLVVGTGQSGCQIAEDLHLAGRRVHLAVGSAPRTARRYRGRDVVDWLEDMGYYTLPVNEHPLKERVRAKANHYVTGRDGGRDIDLRQRAREGMRLYGHVQGARGTRLLFVGDLKQNLDQADAVAESIKNSIDKYIVERVVDAPIEARYRPVWEPTGETASLDLAAAPITTVIWCTGFHSDYRWVEVPIFDGRGYPVHFRGVTAAAGLYFLGLPWLHTWGSGRFSGVAVDADYLGDRVEERASASLFAPVPVVNEAALGS
jgi:putative flavoprotein involved in K+ transport